MTTVRPSGQGRPRLDTYDAPHNSRYSNPVYQRERSRARTAHRYAYVSAWRDELKSSVGCQVCGEREPVALDFHHLNEATKAYSPAQAILRRRDVCIEELSKCALLCANCHRKATHRVLNIDNLKAIDPSTVPYPTIPPLLPDWYSA